MDGKASKRKYFQEYKMRYETELEWDEELDCWTKELFDEKLGSVNVIYAPSKSMEESDAIGYALYGHNIIVEDERLISSPVWGDYATQPLRDYVTEHELEELKSMPNGDPYKHALTEIGALCNLKKSNAPAYITGLNMNFEKLEGGNTGEYAPFFWKWLEDQVSEYGALWGWQEEGLSKSGDKHLNDKNSEVCIDYSDCRKAA